MKKPLKTVWRWIAAACVLLCIAVPVTVHLISGNAKGTGREPGKNTDTMNRQTQEETLSNPAVSERQTQNVTLSAEEKEAWLNQEAEIRHPDVNVFENRKDELVFSLSMNDFIDAYNGLYWNDHHSRYLLPAANWRTQVFDTGVHSAHETVYYNFTADETVWPLPTISVYVPANKDYTQEVTVNFDWHSYSENMYALYEEMCLYTLKIFFPDLSDEQLTALYKEVNAVGYEHVNSSDEWYGKDSVPYALYYKGNIAVYPYFAIGSWQNLCVIPVKEDTLKEFEEKGVIIKEIQ